MKCHADVAPLIPILLTRTSFNSRSNTPRPFHRYCCKCWHVALSAIADAQQPTLSGGCTLLAGRSTEPDPERRPSHRRTPTSSHNCLFGCHRRNGRF